MHPSVVTDPFPHVILDGELPFALMAVNARSEFDAVPKSAWSWFQNDHEGKGAAPFSAGGPTIQRLAKGFADPEWIKVVEAMFGIPNLSFDELGGGLHRIKPGGHLGIHVDFNQHPDGRYRRVNLLLFLNRDPHPSGDLQLRRSPDESPSDVSIAPLMGRTVMFATSESSWHGHPYPLQGGVERRSLAVYYYTAEPPAEVAEPHSTIFA